MKRKQLSTILRIMTIGLTLLTSFALAHDAFYPHHREDFEAIARQRELRGAVLIITVGFVSVLVGVLYLALRKGQEADQTQWQTEQGRLEYASNRAAQAAHTVLLVQGASEAIRAALAAYANASGAAWNQKSVVVTGTAIRCKIGSDMVIIRIFDRGDKCQIEVDAACNAVNARSVLEVMRGVPSIG